MTDVRVIDGVTYARDWRRIPVETMPPEEVEVRYMGDFDLLDYDGVLRPITMVEAMRHKEWCDERYRELLQRRECCGAQVMECGICPRNCPNKCVRIKLAEMEYEDYQRELRKADRGR